MENVTEMSLIDDESDPAARPHQAAQPAQPMVVVQYRQRGVPWWLLSLLTILVPICTILIYHSMVVGRYRAETVQAADAVKSLLNNAPRAEVKKPAEVPLPLALNSQPIATPDGPGGGTSTVSVVGTVIAGSSRPSGESPQPPAGQERLIPAGSESASAPVAKTLIPTTAKAAVEFGNAPSVAGTGTATKEGAVGPESAPAKSGVDSKEATTAVAPTAAKTVIDRPSDPRSPFDDPSEETANAKPLPSGDANPRGRSPDLASAKADERLPVARPDGLEVPPAVQPLPTREETERQMQEEAARNAAMIREQEAQRAVELQSMRYRERVKFREELSAVLQQHGKEAGPEIDQLVKRYGFENDPERWRQADLYWQRSRSSLATKVKYIRGLDLPEAVIFTLLFDDFHTKIRTRNGPRNDNEVRIAAANQLLRLELPAADAMPTKVQPVDSGTGRTARYRALPADHPVGRRQ